MKLSEVYIFFFVLLKYVLCIKVKVKYLCFNSTTPWRRIGKWRYSSKHSRLRH